MSKNYCGDCVHFIGGGAFDLCCDIRHPTPKEVEMGIRYDYGFLCSADTRACDEFINKWEN